MRAHDTDDPVLSPSAEQQHDFAAAERTQVYAVFGGGKDDLVSTRMVKIVEVRRRMVHAMPNERSLAGEHDVVLPTR